MNNEQLIKKLESIKGNNFQLQEEENAYKLAKTMIEHIGSINPYLRDHLIYITLNNLIKNDEFTSEQLREFLLIRVDQNHLHHGIGEKDTDTVFTRTFSILLTASILVKHNKEPFIPFNEFEDIKESVFDYAKKEIDIRGFVEEKGWAHSIAHLADCLDELAICTYVGKDDLKKILELISDRVMEDTSVFTCEEDERLVSAVISIMNRQLLSHKELFDWLETFSDVTKTGNYMADYYVKINCKHFLRSLYFRISNSDVEIRKVVKKTLDVFTTF